MWIDYTRRNDPACVEGLHIFKEKLLHNKRPTVLCFWTKNPKLVGELYGNIIAELRKGGTTVLAQVTINPGYQEKMEPGIKEKFWDMGEFIRLLGGPEHIRLRFDPIIKGFTTPAMFQEHCRIAKNWGIKRTTVNFMVPEYKNVGKLLAKQGLAVGSFSKEEKIKILKYLVVTAQKYGLEVAACAETAGFASEVPGLIPAKCADPDWAKALGAEGQFKGHPSRKGCGCCYSDDWGVYHNSGGYRCPHQCLYCYAK